MRTGMNPGGETGLACDRLCFIGTDIYVECSMAAHKMGEHLGGEGEIAVVGVIDENNAEAEIKTRIFVSQLRNHYPGVKVVSIEGCGKYDIKNESRSIAAKVLGEHPGVRGIYSNADEAMLGITQAAGELGLDGLCVIGYGNEPHLMELVREGRITYAFLHNRFAYGYDSMVILYNALVAGITPPRKRLLHTPEVVTLETQGEYWDPSEGYLVSDATKRHLPEPVKERPARRLRFELQLEGVGTWFEDVIKGAKEAERLLPDTEVVVNNWKVSGLSPREIDEKRMTEVQRARDEGMDAVVLWVLNDRLIPHINEAVAGGMGVVVFHTEPVNYDAITPEVDEVFTSLFRQIILRDAAETRLRKLSNEDELTGLYNRRRFNSFMEEEWRSLSRVGQGVVSVLMIDVDHFKRFNDAHGHLTGDACLKEVARVIRNGVRRARDFPARYGGEEFCVVLPNTEWEGALLMAEHIRGSVETGTLAGCDPFEEVTVSVGVASVGPDSNLDGGWERLVKRADDALYLAKKNGRNRVEVLEGEW